MRRNYLCTALLSFTLFISSATLAAPVEKLSTLTKLLPAGTHVAYIIGQPITVHSTAAAQTQAAANTELLLAPASTQKLITALAAKLYLTDSFRFTTSLHGHITAQQLDNAEFIFSGDPTFKRADLRRMLQQLKTKGITRISGDIHLNQSRFNGYNWSNGQVWNDQSVCYATQASALVINGNCVLGNLKRHPDQDNASIFVPAYEPVTIRSQVKILTKAQQQASFCDLEVNREANNSYTLFGCITPSKYNLPLAFAISDPNAYFTAILKAELKSANITFNGQVVSKHSASASAVIIHHQSQPLVGLITKMVKDSDNLIADILFKTLGAEYFNQPGNYRNGAEAVRLILAKEGLSLANHAIADGSGLSRHNLVSPQSLFSVLGYIIDHDDKLGLLADLPISGIDGTLQYRRGLLSPLLKGNVAAKTGSLKGLANLVGVIDTTQQHRIPFVLMISGYNPTAPELSLSAGKSSPSPLTQYFDAFFSTLMQDY